MVTYTDSLAGITSAHLNGGFFEGWPHYPNPEAHLVVLQAASAVILAQDEQGQVIGFITALSDGVLCAYIPLLEVLPEYRDQGVGSELVRRMIAKLSPIYMIDLLCDAHLQPYYERLGMSRASGMYVRNYTSQAGLMTERTEET